MTKCDYCQSEAMFRTSAPENVCQEHLLTDPAVGLPFKEFIETTNVLTECNNDIIRNYALKMVTHILYNTELIREI
jgi:hypothetical protein